MADVERVVKILFEGDDRVSNVITGVSGGLNSLDATIQSVAAPLAKVGDAVMGLDAVLAAMAAGGMALAVKEAGTFRNQVSEISTLITDSSFSTEKYGRDILDYSKNAKLSIGDINAALYAAISAGVDYKHSIDFVSQAEKLAVAGRANLNDTTRILVSTLNAYGASTSEAGHYSDVLFETVKLGQTTVPELAQSLANVIGIASSGHVPFETLSAAISALTVSGLQTPEAIVGLRGVINAIISPSAQAAKAAKDLGIEFNSEALASRGLEGILKDVYTATHGNVGEIAGLFNNVRALNAALILGADQSGKFASALEQMKNVTGATQTAYDKMAQTFEAVNQQLANNVKVTLIDVGQKVQDTYTDVAGGVVAVFQAMGKSVNEGSFDPLFALINQFGEKLTVFLKALAEAMPEAFKEIDWSGVIDNLRSLGDELSGLFGNVDLTDPQELSKVIQGVVDTIGSLIKVTQGMIEYFEPLWAAVKESIDRFNGLDEGAQKSFGNVLAAAELVVHAGTLIAGALIAIKESGTDIQNVFDLFYGSVKAVWNSLEVVFSLMAETIVSGLLLITNAAEKITSIIPGMDGLNKSLQDASNSLVNYLNGIREELGHDSAQMVEGLSMAWAGVTGSAQKAGSAIKGVKSDLDALPEKKTTTLKTDVDSDAQGIIDWSKEPSVKDLIILPKADVAKTEAAKTQIVSQIAAAKPAVQIEPKMDDTAVKVMFQTLQKSMELNAQIDITNIKAAADIIKADFASITAGIKSTGSTMTDLFGKLINPDTNIMDKYTIESQIRTEASQRAQEFDMQRQLNDAQVDLARAKAKAIQEGKNTITVQADGLKPHLEEILWEILKATQIRINEEGAEFLVGV